MEKPYQRFDEALLWAVYWNKVVYLYTVAGHSLHLLMGLAEISIPRKYG
jgi:hypothetical protein